MKFVRTIAKSVLPRGVIELLLRKGYHPYLRVRERFYKYRMGFLFSASRLFSGKYRYPKQLTIFLTSRCNLRCFICRTDSLLAKEDVLFENISKLANAIKHARIVNLTSAGEALLYPRFEEILGYIYSLNSGKNLIQLATNGTLLSGAHARLLNGHLDSLRISLNAATKDTYERDMRHGNYAHTLNAIRSFMQQLDASERRKVCLHFVAHGNNYLEIPEFVQLAANLGIPTVSVSQFIVTIEEQLPYSLLHVREEYNKIVDRAKGQGDKLGIRVIANRFLAKRPYAPQCMAFFDECYIEVNGDISPCCLVAGQAAVNIGNVYKTDFEAVWFGETYRRIRKRGVIPACIKCPHYLPFDDYYAHFYKISPGR